MDSKAKPLGHPIHQMPIVFPLGLLATALVFDVVTLITGNGYWSGLAYWMIAAGVISGLLHGWPVRLGARVGAVLGGRAITVSGDWEAARVGEDAPHLLEQYIAAVGAVEDSA